MRSLLGRFHRPFARGVDEQLLLLNNLGDGSTLSLDFTTGVLDPRLTFSRLGGGTYVGNDGFVYGVDFATSSSLAIGTGSKSVTLTATAGVSRRYEIGQTAYISSGANNMSGAVTAYNASTQVLTINATSTSGSGSFTSWIVGNASPRFDYDPSTLQPRGLLIEGSANNLVAYSEGMATNGPPGWSGVNITRTANTGGTAPDGSTNTATKFRSTAAINSSTEYIHTLLTGLTTGATYTFSLWAKADGAEWIWVSFRYFGVDNGSFFQLTGNGVLGNTTGTIVSKSIVKHPNGWYRITISHALSGGATVAYPFFIPCTSNGTGYASITGQTPNGVLCWGGQVELGSGASSYIPTGASTGSRAFDSCVMDDITSCNYSTKTGTLFYAGRFTQMNASSFPNRVGFTRETGDFRAFAALSTTTALLPCFANSGTTVLATQNITLNSELKLAFSFDADLSTAEVKSSLNGGSIVQSGSSALTESSVPTYFMLGQKGYGAFFPHGTVRSVKYWPTALSTAQLQALTT